jgi:hypothetical protein
MTCWQLARTWPIRSTIVALLIAGLSASLMRTAISYYSVYDRPIPPQVLGWSVAPIPGYSGWHSLRISMQTPPSEQCVRFRSEVTLLNPDEVEAGSERHYSQLGASASGLGVGIPGQFTAYYLLDPTFNGKFMFQDRTVFLCPIFPGLVLIRHPTTDWILMNTNGDKT